MDLVGVLMGYVSVPMALLTGASLFAAIFLLASGGQGLVFSTIAAFFVGLALAALLERIAIVFDGFAWAAVGRSGRRTGMAIGIIGAALPIIALLIWEYASFRLLAGHGEAYPLARYLLSYGVATGPWTVYALTVGSDRRTLCGIRAYAGHLGYWLMTALVVAGIESELAGFAMLLPAILPLSVGVLLSVGDRDALINVRI